MRSSRAAPSVLLSLLVAGGVAGCSGTNADFGNAPGENVTVGDIQVRYAHLEDPEDADRYPAGSDVPLYVWFRNEGDDPVELTDVSSDLASQISLTDGELPLELPAGELVELGPADEHFLLEDISRDIRAQDLIDVKMTFSNDATVELEVEAIEVDPDEMDL